MRSAAAMLVALALCACGANEPMAVARTGPPTDTPLDPPTGSPTAWLWVMVVEATGACIPGATVQVVAGQAAGNLVTQETPCSVWDYAGGVEYHKLVAGVPMTLRAAAPGYSTVDSTVAPTTGAQSATIFELHRLH